MIKTNELLLEINSLPADMRATLAHKILESLNPPMYDVDEFWSKVSEKRVQEIKSGKVTTVPGNEVFEKIRSKMK